MGMRQDVAPRRSDQPRRFERPPLDIERVENRLKIRWRSQRKAGMVGKKTCPFRRRPLRMLDLLDVRVRMQLRQPVTAGRRHRHRGDGVDDAIEFEGP